MWKTIKVIFLSFTLSKSVLSDDDCTVRHQKTNRQRKCVFPFTLKDDGVETIYNTCTDAFDPDGRYWCSLKVRICEP